MFTWLSNNVLAKRQAENMERYVSWLCSEEKHIFPLWQCFLWHYEAIVLPCWLLCCGGVRCTGGPLCALLARLNQTHFCRIDGLTAVGEFLAVTLSRVVVTVTPTMRDSVTVWQRNSWPPLCSQFADPVSISRWLGLRGVWFGLFPQMSPRVVG